MAKCEFCGKEIEDASEVTKIFYGQKFHLVHKSCLEQKLDERREE